VPDGWKYETSAPDRVDMVWQNNNGAFLIILLTAPQSSSGDPDKDFALAWRALVETDPRMALPSPIYDVRGSVGYAATWSGGSVANLLAEESEIGLVDQGGGLQDMARRFTAKSCRRPATQFPVDDRDECVMRREVAAAPRVQQSRYVVVGTGQGALSAVIFGLQGPRSTGRFDRRAPPTTVHRKGENAQGGCDEIRDCADDEALGQGLPVRWCASCGRLCRRNGGAYKSERGCGRLWFGVDGATKPRASCDEGVLRVHGRRRLLLHDNVLEPRVDQGWLEGRLRHGGRSHRAGQRHRPRDAGA
jgi:hypothetical protein